MVLVSCSKVAGIFSADNFASLQVKENIVLFYLNTQKISTKEQTRSSGYCFFGKILLEFLNFGKKSVKNFVIFSRLQTTLCEFSLRLLQLSGFLAPAI